LKNIQDFLHGRRFKQIGFEKLYRYYTGEDLNKLGFEFKPELVLDRVGVGFCCLLS
jgi:hypothetical protein